MPLVKNPHPKLAIFMPAMKAPHTSKIKVVVQPVKIISLAAADRIPPASHTTYCL